MSDADDFNDDEHRRRKRRTRRKRKNTPQAKRLSNILYDARWALAAALIGIPLLVGILRAIGGM